ncbi:MAG: hypothetical protein K8R18_15780 [Parvibaculum sp.]|uniref:hypothetical protein n=1 Tax=Parvibaculum sp. TaxID=2024848 RepID=UPI0025CFDB1F|nr:hypothetical protein [Parvibaculum sp.]MCE9651079.1 hypothetical protein [Parvibaculum sp.]
MMPILDRARRFADTRLALVLPFAVGLYALFRGLRAFGSFNHNDHMYVAAASMFPQFALYREIAYVQVPLNIFLYAAIKAVAGPSLLYAGAKLASIALVFGAAALAAKTAHRLVPRSHVFWAVFVLVLFNGSIYGNMLQAGNYALPVFLFSVACFLHFNDRQTALWAVATGLAMGLAASSKVSFVTLAGAFVLLLLLDAGARRYTLYYIAGVLIGLAPVFYYLALDPSDFIFLNFKFHLATNEFRGLSALHSLKSVAFGCVVFAVNALPVLAVAALGTWLAGHDVRARLWSGGIPASVRLIAVKAAILFLAASVAAVQPMIYFMNYWNAAALVLVMFAVPAASAIAGEGKEPAFKSRLVAGLMAVMFAAIVLDGAHLVRQIRSTYAPITIMQTQRALAATLASALARHPACVGDILSASGIPVVGTGVPLSTGSSGGSFLFRIAGALPAENAAFAKYTDVGRYLGPHTGLLVGFYADSDFERRMRDFAAGHDFRLAGTYHYPRHPLTLYLPPECAD